MKHTITLSLLAATMLMLGGCGGGDEEKKSSVTKPDVPGILLRDFDIAVCTQEDANKEVCSPAQALDLQNHNVAVFSPPAKIGVGEYTYYDGKRFGVVPKEENAITPLNMLAYGLFLYAQDVGSDWCGPCRLIAPKNYADAKALLKKSFRLTGTDAQNDALLWLLNRNLEQLGEQQLSLKTAYFADIKAMAESLVNLAVKGEAPDLSGLHPVKDAHGRTVGVSTTPQNGCPDYMGGCLENWGLVDKKRATRLGMKIHKTLGVPLAYEQAFEPFTCENAETKEIFMYGVPDDFAPTNSEPVNPQGTLGATYLSWPVHSNYDNNTSMPSTANPNQFNPLYFAETLSGLPTNMTKGRIAIGVKRLEKTPGQTQIIFGDITIPDGATMHVNHPQNDGWSQIPGSHTYYHDLGNMSFQNGQNSALSHIQSGTDHLDVMTAGWLDIDYIAVAACVPEPKGIPIPEVPVKLECNADKGEQLVTVWGGNGDDFIAPVDPTNPPAGLGNTLVKYDQPIEKVGTFADRITLPTQTITQMVVTINTRPSINGYQNDQMWLGDVTTQNGVVHDPNDPGVAATINGGTAHQINGNTGVSGGGMLTSLVNSTHYMDVIVKDQTEVDSVRVSMCVVDKKEGDLAIVKKAEKTYQEGGVNYAIFSIGVTGTLPAGQTLVINEQIPQGATLSSLNAPLPWVCNQTLPITGAATLTCSITATNGDITNIQPLSLTMYTKERTLRNCAAIDAKSQNTFYNNNDTNDNSCDSVTFRPIDPPRACTQQQIISLDNPQNWYLNNGTAQPNVNNPIPSTWDNTYTWFQMPNTPYAYYTLESREFCACGTPGKLDVQGMRTDNVGSIQLDNITDHVLTTVAAQTTASSHNFLQAYPAASGSTVIGPNLVGKNYKLRFNIHNHKGKSGGALKGSLTFTGHWGRCTPEDHINIIILDPVDVGPVVTLPYPDVVTGGNPDQNTTIAVIDAEASISTDSFPVPVTPIPIVVTGGDLVEVKTTPQQKFGDRLPQNYDIAVGCAQGYIGVVIKQAVTHVYETAYRCQGNWIKYKTLP